MSIPTYFFFHKAVYPGTGILDLLWCHAIHPQGSTSYTAEITYENTTRQGVDSRYTTDRHGLSKSQTLVSYKWVLSTWEFGSMSFCAKFASRVTEKILHKCPAFGLIPLWRSRCSAQGHDMDLQDESWIIPLQWFEIQNQSPVWVSETGHGRADAFPSFSLKPNLFLVMLWSTPLVVGTVKFS